MKSILITGASGFIGSFLVEEALHLGMQVWAGVRRSSSRRYLQQSELHFLELDFAHPDTLRSQLATHCAQYGAFDYVIHCAGATKCLDKADFERINYQQTRAFVDALNSLNAVPARFVFISTLSVFGPIHEADYAPITDTDTPQPNTAYGASKLQAERYLQSLPDFPYVIFRPTGVYGPRERDYFLMAQSIRRHVDFSVGYRRQDLTFVYVRDVVQAVFRSLERPVTRRAYFLSDGAVYSSHDFSKLLARELGNPFYLRICAPLWMLRGISWIVERIARLQGKPATLNSDKYRIMSQRNWRCDITPACRELGYQPRYLLEQGVKETMDWYKAEGWIS